jgi:large subunit ribosomal protein L9
VYNKKEPKTSRFERFYIWAINEILMQVIFVKDLPGTGRKGEAKEFNDGYARNFLITKGYAVIASEQALNKINNEQKQQDAKKKRELERNTDIKNELDKRTFTLVVKVGDKGQIFGSVSEKDVLLKIREKTKLDFEKNQITLPKNLKQLGEYPMQIKLGKGLVANPKIKLVDKI